MKVADYFLLGIIAVLVVISIIAMYRMKKRGKSLSCGGSCSGCSQCEIEKEGINHETGRGNDGTDCEHCKRG